MRDVDHCLVRINVLTLKFSVEIQNLVTGVHTFAYGTNWEINFVKDHSNFYLVIMYLILITFSLDSFTDTVRRNLILVTLGVLRVLCKSNLGCSQTVSQLVGMARIYIVRVNAKIRHRETGESWGFLDIHAFSILPFPTIVGPGRIQIQTCIPVNSQILEGIPFNNRNSPLDVFHLWRPRGR